MIKRWLASLIITASIGSVVFSATAPITVSAACESRFLGLPSWFRGVSKEEGGECRIVTPSDPAAAGMNIDSLSNFIWRIVLNVVEMGLVLVSYISVFFIIYGGFRLFASEGLVDKRVQAQKVIGNAVVGLVLSIMSVAIINFLFSRIFG